jgi:hypothetical protein
MFLFVSLYSFCLFTRSNKHLVGLDYFPVTILLRNNMSTYIHVVFSHFSVVVVLIIQIKDRTHFHIQNLQSLYSPIHSLFSEYSPILFCIIYFLIKLIKVKFNQIKFYLQINQINVNDYRIRSFQSENRIFRTRFRNISLSS